MRLILVIIAGVFLVTYSWGWVIHVQDGLMGTKRYTEYYLNEVNDQIHYLIEESGKIIAFVKKPLPERKEFSI